MPVNPPAISPQTVFLSAMLIIALGYVMRKSGLLDRGHGNVLAKIVMNVTLPAVILQTVPQVEFTPTLFFLPVLAVLHAVVAFFVVQFLFRRRPPLERGLITILSLGFNNGLFAFPIVREIWGIEAIKLLALFDVGNGIVILGVNYVIAAWFAKGGEMKIGETLRVVGRAFATSVPLIVFAVALVMNLTGVFLPAAVERAVGSVASANGFLALAVLGIFQSLRIHKEDLPEILRILGIRYVLGIVFAVVSVHFLGSTEMFARVLSIVFVLPVGMVVIPYTVAFGYDTRLATTVVNISIIVSFLAMWGIVVVGG